MKKWATGLRGFDGQPLCPDAETRVQAFLDDPSESTWDACAFVVVGPPLITLARAVRRIYPAFRAARQSDGTWRQVPDAFTVRRALRDLTTHTGPCK